MDQKAVVQISLKSLTKEELAREGRHILYRITTDAELAALNSAQVRTHFEDVAQSEVVGLMIGKE